MVQVAETAFGGTAKKPKLGKRYAKSNTTDTVGDMAKPGAKAQPLNDTDAAQWASAKNAVLALADGIKTEPTDTKHLNRLVADVVAIPLHLETVLNALHIPEDAGDLDTAITNILRRIPDGWGRWISCDKGWYPLIVALDKELAAICPDYELHQVKEKFGTLRYYFTIPHIETQCCIDDDTQDPRPMQGVAKTHEDIKQISKWMARKALHRTSVTCVNANLALNAERKRRASLYSAMSDIVDKYEVRTAQTCELTGKPGILMENGGWLKTLDAASAPDGYKTVPNGTEEEGDGVNKMLAQGLQTKDLECFMQTYKINTEGQLLEDTIDGYKNTNYRGHIRAYNILHRNDDTEQPLLIEYDFKFTNGVLESITDITLLPDGSKPAQSEQ